MKPVVKIVILSRNRSYQLAQAVASIREFTKWPYHIIIRDHGSKLTEQAHIAQLRAQDVTVDYTGKFYSCNEGRRKALNYCEPGDFMAFIDDDLKVGPEWLSSMMRVILKRPRAAAVGCNLIMRDRTDNHSSLRYRLGSHECKMKHLGYIGKSQMAAGGCTLYRADALKDTEYRKEFDGGYEDWDQTLQLTQNLGYEIWGSRASLFHNHYKLDNGYELDRWRFNDMMESALGIWDRWKIRTAAAAVFGDLMRMGIKLSKDHTNRIADVMTK